MKFKDLARYLHPSSQDLFGNGGMIVTDANPAYEYKDGVRTTIRCGTRISGVSPVCGYLRMSVTVKEEVDITAEDLASGPILVSFVNFTSKFFYSKDAQDYLLSCHADEVVFLDAPDTKGGGKRD